MFDNSGLSGPRLIASGRSSQDTTIVDPTDWARLREEKMMARSRESKPTPLDRVEDVPRILKAMTEAVREAVLRHKRLGNRVVVWRGGRVVWLAPDEIPAGDEEPGLPGA